MKLSITPRVLAVIAAWSPALAGAQAFPSKPIRMIVSFPSGGGTDSVARVISPKLSEALGQQVVIDNRAGADGVVATELAAKSPPDGHTVFLATTGNLTINQSLYPKVSFDIARDFMPVGQVVALDMMLTVHPAFPARSIGELVALAKAQPGALSYASAGVGGIPHLTMELLNFTAGIRIQHIPYKGGVPALTDVVGGRVPMMIQSVVQGQQLVKSGKLVSIALLSSKRSALLPSVPTAAESMPGFEASNWYGMVIPANTPAAIQKRLYEEIAKVLRLPDIRERLVTMGAEPASSTPEEFAAFMKSETAKWARVIKQASVRAE